MILVSCKAGVPNNSMVEKANGTWSTIFEKYNGSIILCKWDVDTKKTIELLNIVYDFVLDEQVSLDRALVLAQHKLRKKYPNNPEFWSGVEFWMN